MSDAAPIGLKEDLVEDPSAKSQTNKAIMNIVKNVVTITTCAALVSTIITGYKELSKQYLDESVAEFKILKADAKNKDEFTRLENKFKGTHEGVERLINATKESWSDPRTVVAKLKQEFESVEAEKEKFTQDERTI